MARDKFVSPKKATSKEIVNISQIKQCWLSNSELTICISYGSNALLVTFHDSTDCREFFEYIKTELKVTEV